MSLALRLKLGQRLLMRLDRTRSSTSPPLKRPFSTAAEARVTSPDPSLRSEPSAKRPRKASRQTSPMRSFGQPSSSKPRGRRPGGGPNRGGGRSSSSQKPHVPRAHDNRKSLPAEGDPVHDDAWIKSTYPGVPVKETWVTNPKSTVFNWTQNQGKDRPEFSHETVVLHGHTGVRCVHKHNLDACI